MHAMLRRQTSDQRLIWFVAASLALHAVGAGVAKFAARPKFTPRQSIEIALAPAGNNKPAEAIAAPPAPAKPSPPAPIPKAVETKPPPKPQAKTEPKPKPPAPTPKPAPPPAAVVPAPTPPAVGEPAPSATQTLSDVRKLLEAKKDTAGTGDGIEGAYALPSSVRGRLYFSQLEAAIRSAWAVPPGVRRTPVEIEVLIGSTGKLIQRRLRESSGDTLLDRSALAAVDSADIPAPPAEFRTPLRLILRLIPPEN